MNSTTSLKQCLLLCMTMLISVWSYATPPTDVIEDDVLFSLQCPPDKHVSCDAELWDLDIFGRARYKDYSGWHDAGEPYVSKSMNSCGSGWIKRTWTVHDPYAGVPVSCTQTIYVGGGRGQFSASDIHWPTKEVMLEGCNPGTHPNDLDYADGWPRWNNIECSSVGVSYRDQVFYVDDACRKIVRTWTVMDWCQSNSGHWGGGGKWTYQQKIKIIGGEKPTVTCPDDVTEDSYNCKNAPVTVAPLSVYGENCNNDYTITHNSPYAYKQGADISGVYPVGKTTVKYTIKYGCTKRMHCSVDVYVKDSKGPSVYCYGELTLALMGLDNDDDGVNDEGMVELWAKDMDKGSTASCGGGMLRYSFSEDPTDDVKVFTCDDLGENLVRMYVTDRGGRQNYCEVKIHIQNNGANIQNCVRASDDNNDDTDDDNNDTDDDDDNNNDDDNDTDVDSTGTYSIAGFISDQTGAQLSGADLVLENAKAAIEVIVSSDTTIQQGVVDSFYSGSGTLLYEMGNDTTITYSYDTVSTRKLYEKKTNADGNYLFKHVAKSESNFTLTVPEYRGAAADYVDVNDLMALLNHVHGVESLTTLEQMIAADVDQNRVVDAKDLELLLAYLNGTSDSVLDSTWTIVPVPYFNVAQVDTAFAEYGNTWNIRVDSTDQMDIAWKAIKIGNVNGKVKNTIDEAEKSTQLELIENEIAIRKGTIVYDPVVVMPNPFTDQFSIEYPDVKEGVLDIQVYDMRGQLVYGSSVYTTVGNNRIDIDLTDMQGSGILLYRLLDGDRISTGKIIKN